MVTADLSATDWDAIATSTLFRGVSMEAVEGLLANCSVEEFAKDTVMLAPGEENTKVYLLLSGLVNVHLGAIEFPPHVVLGAGECVGELSLIDGRCVSAFVRVQQSCCAVVISEETLWRLINASHGVARNLLFILSGRMRSSNEAILDGVRLQRQFEHYASVDALTGLHNRRWLDEVFVRQITRCQNDGKPLVLIMLDVDYFKKFNDNYGHIAGDMALCTLARTLIAHLRPSDQVARYGGEEFLLIMPETTLHEAWVVADRVRLAVAATPVMTDDGTDLPAVTISLGLAEMRPEDTAEKLIAAADAAMYRAKQGGRNRVCE